MTIDSVGEIGKISMCFSPQDPGYGGPGRMVERKLINLLFIRESGDVHVLENRDQLTSDGETAEAPLLLQLASLANGGLGRDDNGVKDEAVLVTLDLADHLSLLLNRAVVVDHTNAAKKSHVDSHVGLGDGVHGRGSEGGLEGDVAGELGGHVDLGGREANVTRQEQEVVVCLTAHLLLIQELVDRDTILGLILLEQLEGLGGVLDLDAVGRHGAGDDVVVFGGDKCATVRSLRTNEGLLVGISNAQI
jgi:hypothetical protein